MSLISNEKQLTVESIDRLFEDMSLLFGRKFTEQWQTVDPARMKQLWLRELSGYSREELRKGYTALKTLTYPPTLGEFTKLCRTPVDPIVAYTEALAGLRARSKGNMGTWSHKAVYWTAAALAHDIQHSTYNQIRHIWEAELQKRLSDSNLPDIPAPSQQIHYTPTPAPVVAEKIAVAFDKKGDGRDWARKILARKESGEEVSFICEQFAREALDMPVEVTI